jgi:hypothetical protein
VFDLQKNQLNQAKHGVNLALANQLERDWALATIDDRKDYGETRMIGFAPIADRVYCVVFVDRGRQRRIISFRNANQREVKSYAVCFNS